MCEKQSLTDFSNRLLEAVLLITSDMFGLGHKLKVIKIHLRKQMNGKNENQIYHHTIIIVMDVMQV